MKKLFLFGPKEVIPGMSHEKLIEYKFLFEEKFNENHMFLIGTNSHVIKDGSTEYYNSLSIYDDQLKVINSYNKINLVPFGEFLPIEKIFKKFGLKSITNNYQSYTKAIKEIL